jgi:hypothetical protein
MSRHLKFRLVTILLILCAFLFVAHVQAAQNPQIYGGPDGLTGADCEGVMMRLDFIIMAAEESGKEQAIIIIARLGTGETSRKLIASRLRQVADYLNRRIPRGRIITAEGERVRGLGQLEFYVGGKMHSIFKVKRNRDLVAGCGTT